MTGIGVRSTVTIHVLFVQSAQRLNSTENSMQYIGAEARNFQNPNFYPSLDIPHTNWIHQPDQYD